MLALEDMSGILDVFAKTGGPAVVTLVVVGYLVWKGAGPMLLQLISGISQLAADVRDLTKEMNRMVTELRLMSERVDNLEHQVSRVVPRKEETRAG